MNSIPLFAYIIAAVLFLLWVGLVVYLVVRKRKEAAPKKPPPKQIDLAALEEIKKDVRDRLAVARKLFLAKVPDRDAQANINRLLVIGESGSGKSTFIQGTGMGALLAAENAPPAGDKASCNVWLFKKGLVVEAAGRLVLAGDGSDPGDEPFDLLLKGLKRERNERPIDGLVLALSCRDLLPGAATAEDRKRKATVLQKKIADAQRTLEMRVPIYVVVTQCDTITGFESFAAELSPERRHAVLGWSSAQTPFSDKVVDWAGEAIDTVRHDLAREQSRRFAAAGAVRGVDDFFLFPSELAELREGLRAYIDEIFIPGADGPFALRGIYFSGTDKSAVPPPPPAPLPPGVPTPPIVAETPNVLFARELFERKIFPEANVARPNFNAIRRRNRVILALQAASVVVALVFGGVMAIESDRLSRETQSVLPYLHDLEPALRQLKSESPQADPTGELRRERAITLFKGISAIDTNGLRSVFIPGSWPSRIDGRLENAVHTGYERVILSAFRQDLVNKAEALVRPDDIPFASSLQGTAIALEKTPEFVRVEEWLRDLGAFEANVGRFDGLIDPLDVLVSSGRVPPERATPDARIQDVAELSQYLFSYKVEPSYKAEYYRRALTRGAALQPFDLAVHRDAARDKANLLFKALYRRMLEVYTDDLIRADLEALIKGLEELEKNSPDYTPDKLWELRDVIGRMEKHLAAPGLAWIAGGTLPSNPGIGRLLDAVKASRLLGTGLQDALKDRGESRLLLLRSDLESSSTPLSGFILGRKDGVVQMALSPFILSLKAPIDALRRQSFMSGGDDAALPTDIDDTRLSWDVELLKDTAKLPKDYETFSQEGGFKNFPEQVQPAISALALRKLKAKVLSGVSKSAHREIALQASQARLLETARTDVGNFALASVPLREIIAALGRLHLDDARDRMRDLTRAQGARLLVLSARVLESSALYEVRDGTFAWWNGDGTPVFQAFGVPDSARLTEYAVAQRGRADTYAKELAEPVLSTLESVEVGVEEGQNVPGMATWQQVVNPLRDHENKKAGNGVSNLERFLLTDMPTVNFENCLPELERVGKGVTSRDFFTQRMMRIRGLLHDQCVALASQDVRIRYATLRRYFNRDLAGKFPFWRPEPGVKGRPEDAAPEAVRRFLQTAAEFRSRYRSLLAARGDKSALEVVRFLDQMNKVEAFLMPMWAQTEAAAEGVYEVSVDFRINQTREVGGNQIAEWAIKFADDRLFLDGPKSASRWHIGDPVELTLRWAKNSPDVPSASQDAYDATVKERHVFFAEKGSWALLRMIFEHQTSSRDATGGADSIPHVLLFTARTIPDPTGGFVDRVGTGEGSVRVFVRIVVTGNEKDKPLKYPDFPTVAPAL